MVSPGGELATQLATGFNGTTFAFPNALDIDQANQIVYFIDAGAIFFSRFVENSNIIKLFKRSWRLTCLIKLGKIDCFAGIFPRSSRAMTLQESYTNMMQELKRCHCY